MAITSRQKTSSRENSSKGLVYSAIPLFEKKPQIPCASFELDSVVYKNETNIINIHLSKRTQSNLQIPNCEFYTLEMRKTKTSLDTFRRHSIPPVCPQRFNPILSQTKLTLFENDFISSECFRYKNT